MTFPLLLDQGIPRTACGYLRERGFEVVHVFELGMSRSSDRQILDYARGYGDDGHYARRRFSYLAGGWERIISFGLRIRREGLREDALAELVASVWPQIGDQVKSGAMATITDNSIRMRCLPLVPAGEDSDQA